MWEGNTMSSISSMSLYRRKEMRKGARKVEMEEIKALVKWKKCHYFGLWAGGLGIRRKRLNGSEKQAKFFSF